MISVLISAESRYPINRKRIREATGKFIGKVGLDDVEVSVSIVGSRKIKKLNRDFRQTDKPTNVLSFPLETSRDPDKMLRLGDVIICYPVARGEAIREQKMMDEKIEELLVHGLKHLVGEHHE